jgi:hypothetical protein
MTVAANKEATEPRVPFGKVEVITWKILLITGFVTRLTRRVPQVEQEPLTLTVSDCPFGIFKLLL